jgi:putative ABC transport system substrate-binding protein
MRRREFMGVLGTAALALPMRGHAQPAEKIPRVGCIILGSPSGDPVAAGFVDTLAQGKGNLTGLSCMAVELNGKRLELMKELIPTVSRVTLLTNPIHPGDHLGG